MTSSAIIHPQALTVTMATCSSTNETVCKYKKGRITIEQELCLQKHMPFLVKELDSEDIVSDLRANFVLNDNDQENILGRPGNRRSRQDQNKLLIETLMNRTPRRFMIFLDVLRATGHQNAYDTLTVKEDDSGRSGKTQDSQTASLNPSERFEPEPQNRVNGPVIDKTECLDEEFLESNIEDQLHRVADRVGNAETRIDSLEQCLGLTKEEKDNIQDLKQQLKETKDELEKLRGVCAQQARELRSKSEEIKTYQRKLDDQLKASAEHSRELREKSEQLKSAYQKNADQLKIIAELESQVKELEQRLKTIDASMEQLKQKMKKDKTEYDKKIGNLQAEQVEDKRHIAELQKKVAAIEEQRKRDKTEIFDAMKQYVKEMGKKAQSIAREEMRRERKVTQSPAAMPFSKPENNFIQRVNFPVENRSVHARNEPSMVSAKAALSKAAPQKPGNCNLPKICQKSKGPKKPPGPEV